MTCACLSMHEIGFPCTGKQAFCCTTLPNGMCAACCTLTFMQTEVRPSNLTKCSSLFASALDNYVC